MPRRIALAALITATLLGAGVLIAAVPQPTPNIAPKAAKHLKAMSTYLAGLKSFSFQAEEFFDHVQDDGQKLQFSNHRKFIVSRPNKLAGESEGDTHNSRFVYDGHTLAVLDLTHKTYATTKVPGTINAMLDEMHEKYGSDQPLSDFLYSDPYKILTEHVQSGAEVGLHQVGKVKCHHLAFQQRIIDWQIWIETGEKPLPRKLVITFKRRPGEPQFVALLHHWDTNPKLAEDTFQLTPPPGVRKVDFLKRHEDPGPEKGPAPK